VPHLTCIHHVQWVVPIEGGKHFCQYCKTEVAKKDIYPKFDDLGDDFKQAWDRHEKGESAAPAAAAK
jgi:hypothetical protein